MRVARATLRDFRNYDRAEAWLGEGLTVVAGQNGAGKTNLLEAIYFGLTGRSCRTASEREVVRHGGGPARVEVTTTGEAGEHRLEVALDPGRLKTARVDGSAASPATALAARPPVVVFLPDRLELVKGAPARRRAHLDGLVAALWPARSDAHPAYARALAQRNALLARIRSRAAASDDLDAWDAQLARAGAALVAHRDGAVELLRPRLCDRAAELGLAGEVELRYVPRARGEQELAAALGDRRSVDLERGFTTFGPHRDDVGIAHNGRPLRSYGSQGQQRVGLLALLFAERDLLVERDRPPLMLLDDVTSELDGERRERLVDTIVTGGQAVVTTTDPAELSSVGAATTLRVDSGRVRAETVAAPT